MGRPGSVRIIAGRWRGRRVAVPPGDAVRPTPDRVRETLFNWLAAVLPGARCLDLCAGSGVLGLEALSRGATECWFVEREPRAAAAIESALSVFGGAGRVWRTEALRWLQHTPPVPFGVVFADPPYGTIDLGHLCTLLDAGWLADPAWVYLETGRGSPLPDLPAGWHRHRETVAGGVRCALLRRVAITTGES